MIGRDNRHRVTEQRKTIQPLFTSCQLQIQMVLAMPLGPHLNEITEQENCGETHPFAHGVSAPFLSELISRDRSLAGHLFLSGGLPAGGYP